MPSDTPSQLPPLSPLKQITGAMAPPLEKIPDLHHGRPEWPSKDDQHLFWIGLRRDFEFAHHPAHPGDKPPQQTADYYCSPEHLLEKLTLVLCRSSRGSLLVTGYRGTGKTSLVAASRHEFEARHAFRHVLWTKVNLATVSSGQEVLWLTYNALENELVKYTDRCPDKSLKANPQMSAILAKLHKTSHNLSASRYSVTSSARRGLPGPHESPIGSFSPEGETQHTFERTELSRAQSELVGILQELRVAPFDMEVVFVFDELDKLQPTVARRIDPSPETTSTPRRVEKLHQLQTIVAELKYFLTEADSHQIFIAGKDVDDSWSEDQNKGEGLFESIFACNIYVPSIFSTKLAPCKAGPPVASDERRAFYEALARELGITANSWAFNTSLLILPHLAEQELCSLVLRAWRRERRSKQASEWVRICINRLPEGIRRPNPEDLAKLEAEGDHKSFPIMSERTCRRLRILIEYLTYKGRGIPRKIFREFHDMVQQSTIVDQGDPGQWKLGRESEARDPAISYVLALEQHHLQKMNFYAGIVEYLDLSIAELQGLNDKGRVSIYHIIDYILKFYNTGFSQRDIEHANFMTAREEFYPTRQLAALILRTFEGRLWTRKGSRSSDYRMLHNVVHDLSVLYLRYAPEQMELRHTQADFRSELEHLNDSLAHTDGSTSAQRHAPIHAQMRLARILELSGKHFEARIAYLKALRWIRMDIRHFDGEAGQASLSPLSMDSVSRFVGYAVEGLLAVGRLHEELGEHRNALVAYEEAVRFRDNMNALLRVPARQNQHALTPAPEQAERARALLDTLVLPDATDREERFAALALFIAHREVVLPISRTERIDRFAEVHNHRAIAHEKLLENTSANLALLDALFYLHEIGDELGVIEQCFFIGQIMVRKRDFHAAMHWYSEALLRSSELRRTANQVELQSGAEWQIPPTPTATEALILAALGDVCYATNGFALLSHGDVSATRAAATSSPSGSTEAEPLEQHRGLIAKVGARFADLVGKLNLGIYEDHWGEYFHTCARIRFQSIGDTINYTDTHLRQLELRLDEFRGAIRRLESALTGETELTRIKLTVLDSWSNFWQGARILLHANLTSLTALTRDGEHEWGRITGFRRMGILLHLVGEILRELTLHLPTRGTRRLIARQAIANNLAIGRFPRDQNPFCTAFISPQPPDAESEDPLSEPLRICDIATQLAEGKVFSELPHQAKNSLPYNLELLKQPEHFAARKITNPAHLTEARKLIHHHVSINRSVRDIRTIFAFISDKPELLQDPYDDQARPIDLHKIGYRSPLFRISKPIDGPEQIHSPIAYILRICERSVGDKPSHPQACTLTDFRLLTLSEKSLLTAYLCHRDTVGDYSYAQTCLALGGLYISALFLIGSNITTIGNWETDKPVIKETIDRIMELSKRYTTKAINLLKREREHNRNTFHLLSEASFNLGDLLLVRLAWLTETPPELMKKGNESAEKNLCTLLTQCGLFGDCYLNASLADGRPDTVHEDVRRQVWEAYRQGLVFVQNEMDDYAARFRLPPDVFCAHRNIMDAVLHFRICRSARVRHCGGRYGSPGNYAPFDEALYRKNWEEVTRQLEFFESPQRYSYYWESTMEQLIATVEKVRTDRSPLRVHNSKLAWANRDDLGRKGTVDMFNHVVSAPIP